MPDGSHGDPDFDTFESSLDEMLERVSASTRAEQEAREAESPASSSAAPKPKLRSHARLPWGVAALVALGAIVAWTGPWFHAPSALAPALAFEQLPPPAAGPGRVSPSRPPAPVAAASMPAITIDPDASTEAVMLEQLLQDSMTGAVSAPAFAVARYDTLQPAPRGWELLAPLSVEEVYALVPATSRLRELADLRGRRINVGERGSPRARSAEALYRTLFGRPMPLAPLGAASKDVALPALLRGEGLDAMLVFDGQPSAWLATLPVDTRLQLKVLRFDPNGSTAKRALQAYISTSVTPALASERAPVPTLGEVTFLVATRQEAQAPDLVRHLCERLPALRAGGHPKWKEVDPALQLPVPLPRSSGLASAASACSISRGSSTPSSGAFS